MFLTLRNRLILVGVLVVAAVGASSSGAYLAEVHLEQEISTARRTSRHAAGIAIELARALATTFPAFAEALRAGEISEAHCKILVEKTRVVADEAVLGEIERRVLPKAKRLVALSSISRCLEGV